MLSSTHYIHFSESLLLRGSLCHGLPSPESPLTLASSESHRDLSVSHPDTDLWLDQRLITSYSCTSIVGGQKRMHPWSMGPCNQCQCSDNMTPLWLKMEKKNHSAVSRKVKIKICHVLSAYKVNCRGRIWFLRAFCDFQSAFDSSLANAVKSVP